MNKDQHIDKMQSTSMFGKSNSNENDTNMESKVEEITRINKNIGYMAYDDLEQEFSEKKKNLPDGLIYPQSMQKNSFYRESLVGETKLSK